MALGKVAALSHPSFVKVGVAHLLREGSWSLEAASDGIRHERLDTTSSGERHIRTYRRKRRKTPLGWEELSPQMAGSRDTGRQWEGKYDATPWLVGGKRHTMLPG